MTERQQHDHAAERSATPEAYHLGIEMVPSVPRWGEQAQLVSTITHATTGKRASLQRSHEKLLHLIVISRDLASFQHLHPEPGAGEKLEAEVTFPTPGEYWFFADFTPEGEEGQVARTAVTIQGPAPAPEPLRPDADRPREEAGVTARLVTVPETLVAGRDAQIVFQLTDTKSGSAVSDLRPYLGARGHAVILSADGREYLHAHPLEAEAGGSHEGKNGHTGAGPHGQGHHGGDPSTERETEAGRVAFHTRFPAPGIYKVWGQFDVGGVLRTFPFVLSVKRSG